MMGGVGKQRRVARGLVPRSELALRSERSERLEGHEHVDEHEHVNEHEKKKNLSRGSGKGKVLFLDAFSGISGDMLAAALVDLGVPKQVLSSAVKGLKLKGCRLRFAKQSRFGIAATRFIVEADKRQPDRDYAAIRPMLMRAGHLSRGAKRLALAAFDRLARAEAEVHGSKLDKVHFHEVGAVDSIADIVGAAAALDYLGARVICSPLPMGRGMIRCRHGVIPAPAPATVLCLRGAPTYDAGIDAELVTPTGACLVAACASGYSRWPNLASETVGWGAGSKKLPDRPNLLRAVLGRETDMFAGDGRPEQRTHVVIETNVDDLTPEIAAHALEQAFKAGALDVWTTPIGMKKGRPAVMISALARRQELDHVAGTLLAETSALGLRIREVSRIERKRHSVRVNTEYGYISIKVAEGDGLPPNIAPEYEECRKAAEKNGVPIKQVYAAAIAAYSAKRRPPK